jgi:hypothetical protein
MSIGLLGAFGPMILALLATFLIGSSCARFELHFIHKPSVSHFRPFGCKCFVLKRGNLDKFESRSFDGILLGYTPHGRSYRVYNFETNTIIESCDMTFDEIVPCPYGVHDGRANLFLRYPSEANEVRYIRASSQVHEIPNEEV